MPRVLRPALSAIWQAWWDTILPSLCPVCREAPGPDLCDACHKRISAIRHGCPACGAPRADEDRPCQDCADRGHTNLTSVTVPFHYHEGAVELVTAAKAGGSPAAVAVAAQLFVESVGSLPPADAIVPVPPSRHRIPRAPHLATALGRNLAQAHALPLYKILRSRRSAAAQHALSRAERHRNVENLFRAHATPPARVVLVDDLLTSGATAIAAARALRQAGARQVHLFALARTPTPDERRAIGQSTG